MTTVFVDADACPVRDEIYRVAARHGAAVVVVSNGSRPIRPPGLAHVTVVVVEATPDAADDWIAERAGRGDVCATADIPLASRCLARGASAIAFDGREWTTDNIGSALVGRSIGQHLRETGVMTAGRAAFGQGDRTAFLREFDRVVGAARRGARPAINLRSPEV